VWAAAHEPERAKSLNQAVRRGGLANSALGERSPPRYTDARRLEANAPQFEPDVVVIKKQQIRTTVGTRRRPHQRAVKPGWSVPIALALWACLIGGKPVEPEFNGLVSFADAGAFSIVRRDTLLSGSKGVALLAGDIVETGADAFVVIQEPGGDLVGLGPSTQIYLVERQEVITLFVLRGWVKVDVKSGPIRLTGTRLGIQGHQAVMLLHADERSNEVFDEQGSTTLLTADGEARPVGKETEPARFFVRGEQLDVLSQASPSAEFVARMPAPFRDPLPGYTKLPEPVPPHVVRAVSYADIESWLTIPREWRGSFVGRFRGRLKDPAFFAAMDAHQVLLPDWKRILHPPPEPELNHLSESRAEDKSDPQPPQPKQGDEIR
jgi:hypothetical protein